MFSVIVIAAMPLLTRGFSLFPAQFEKYYADSFGLSFGLVFARATRVVPFSVFEILLYTLISYCLLRTLFGAGKVLFRRAGLFRTLGNGIVGLLGLAAFLVVWFYVAWGFGFARPGLIARMEWNEPDPCEPKADRIEELVTLSEELVWVTNESYLEAFGTGDLGRPSEVPLPLTVLDAQLEFSYSDVASRLGLPPAFGYVRGPAKPVLGSALLTRLLILGFFSPWTGEANFNREIPAVQLPHTIAHEKAHQRGITSEDEANFFGFIDCACSTDAYVRYSGYLFAQRQLVNELARLDQNEARKVLSKRSRGVQRDADSIREWHDRHRGAASAASRVVNDAYLKTNRVREGVLSYAMSSRILIAFSRANNGTCLMDTPNGPDSLPVLLARR